MLARYSDCYLFTYLLNMYEAVNHKKIKKNIHVQCAAGVADCTRACVLNLVASGCC